MPVTDEQEATLHAFLAKRFDEHDRLLDALDPVAARRGYNALVTAAFAVAVDERFPEDATKADVIEFVGEVRSRGESGARLDPQMAEQVIMEIITGRDADGLDPREAFSARFILVAVLVADAGMDDAELDVFMRRARKLADQWLA